PLVRVAAARALGADDARAHEERLDQDDPEDGVAHDQLRVHAHTFGYRHGTGSLMPRTGDLAGRLGVARGDEPSALGGRGGGGDAPAGLVRRGGRRRRCFRGEWLGVDGAVVDGVVAGLGSYEGAEILDA